MIRPSFGTLLAITTLFLSACGDTAEGPRIPGADTQPGDADIPIRGAFDDGDWIAAPESMGEALQERATENFSPYAGRLEGPEHPTRVYFGDTHHHTSNSGDAFMAGDRLTPRDAYRFARGQQVTSSSGVSVRLSRPMDFLVVSDHAEGLGVITQVYEGNPSLTGDPTLARWSDAMREGGAAAASAMGELVSAQAQGTLPGPIQDPDVVVPLMRSVWQEYTQTAEDFNEPGVFTAMIGYEWTSVPGVTTSTATSSSGTARTERTRSFPSPHGRVRTRRICGPGWPSTRSGRGVGCSPSPTTATSPMGECSS